MPEGASSRFCTALRSPATLARLSREAERVLAGANYGITRGMLDRISDTLAAAAADPGGRALLRRGVLTQEMRRAGFGDILGAPAVTAQRERAPVPKKASKPSAATPRQVLDAERDAARLAREADRAEADAERLRRALAKAEDEASSARRRVAALEKDAARARVDAEESRKRAAAARREAAKAGEKLGKLRGARRR